VHAVERLGAAVLLRRALAGTRTRERGLERVRRVPHLAAKVAVVSFLTETTWSRRLTAARSLVGAAMAASVARASGGRGSCPRV
jgi:hypothetical protein